MTFKGTGTLREATTKLRSFARRIYVGITFRMVQFIDSIHDRRLCGYNLSNRRKVQVEGSTNYFPSRYWALDIIFKDAVFTSNDRFVDIGCGMGRVLAYLLEKKFPGHLTGIEKDPYVAGIARKWMAKYDDKQVELIEGNALEQQYDGYTIIYIFRPFSEEFFERLVFKLEEQLSHPIRFYYLADRSCIKFLSDRRGWKKIKRDTIFRKYGLCIWECPQSYSIWDYTPTKEIVST